MLDFLFRGLTADARRGAALFEAVTRVAREPHWYVEGQVPDTIDGRFAVLATVTALVLVRFEGEGDRANAASVALTERFIEAMEAEHRELGLGDPTLGKTVRKLVGALARRTDLWRNPGNCEAATRDSLYKWAVAPAALAHSVAAIEGLRGGLEGTGVEAIAAGKLQ